MRRLAFLLVMTAFLAVPVFAQEPAVTYQMPPQVLADIIDAPPTPGVYLTPDKEWLLLLERPGNPSIEEVAAPELRLAGLRINPRANGPSRSRPLNGLVFQNLESGEEVRVTGLPEEPKITGLSFSPDGEKIAFVVNVDDDLTLWYAEVKDGKAKRVTQKGLRLNAVYGRPYAWRFDSKSFVARTVPADRGEAPSEPIAPAGPIVQENLGKKTPARTYQDLLQNHHEEALYDYYNTSQLVLLDLKGTAIKHGEPDIFRSVTVSPDGE